MTGFKQLVTPNLNQTGKAGYCLRFVGDSFVIKPRPYKTALDAWHGAVSKHQDTLPNVCVPVFFSWRGTIDGVTADYGDVAIYVPGAGVFGTPLSGTGNRWDTNVQGRANAIGGGAKYLGWSEDINGVRLVELIKEESMYTKQGIDPNLVSQHFSNYTNGHTVVQPGDDAAQNRFEIVGDDAGANFWRGLNNHQLDVIRSRDATVQNLEKQLAEALANGSNENIVPAAQVDGKVTLWKEK